MVFCRQKSFICAKQHRLDLARAQSGPHGRQRERFVIPSPTCAAGHASDGAVCVQVRIGETAAFCRLLEHLQVAGVGTVQLRVDVNSTQVGGSEYGRWQHALDKGIRLVGQQ